MAHRQKGVVLTYVDSLDTLEDCVRIGGYDAVKVVTGWGLPTGWNDDSRRRVLELVPHVIVRTVSGDPSYGRPIDPLSGGPLPGAKGPNARYWDYDFLNPDRVEEEITPWYRLKPTIMIELGNEPNVFNQDDDFIWIWAYHLEQTIARCRKAFPQATLISPGFMADARGNMRRFYEIAHKQIAMCDYVGVHFYEYYAFTPDKAPATKGELRDVVLLHQQFFPDMPWYITEYGIHNTDQTPRAEKGARYARLIHGGEGWPPLPANIAGAVYYHLQMKGDIHPEYHIYPEGDQSYQAVFAAVGATDEATEILGGGIGATHAADPLESFAGRIAGMSMELAELERELLCQRAAVGLSADEAARLRRLQLMRASLERALRLSGAEAGRHQR
ncbi:MAG: hypothetical protein OHK0015_45970 [Chloroflexi bacterium OHK40]